MAIELARHRLVGLDDVVQLVGDASAEAGPIARAAPRFGGGIWAERTTIA